MPTFSRERWPTDGAVRALLEYLDELHRDAGQPSMREIGKAIGLAHSTVAPFFTGARLVNKGNLELLVQYLGGDPARAERLRRRAATEWNTRSSPPVMEMSSQEIAPLASVRYPKVWNVPRRNSAFTGRESLLAAIRKRLTAGRRALVHALSGIGGVGKTQLAIEYAHLFAHDYELVWWVDAERSELVAEQLAALAIKADWVNEEAAVAAAVEICNERLRLTPRWLMVFDNVDTIEGLAPWLPPESGHVIITSRSVDFAGLTVPVEVGVFTRAESVALLLQNLPAMATTEAGRLAEALGDLPLAVAQASGMMAQTRMPVTEYLTELTERGAYLLSRHTPLGYSVPLAAAIDISVSRLRTEDLAAVQLLHICAALAPEPIRLNWFTAAAPDVLEEPLAANARDRLAWRDTLGRLARYGLMQIGEHTIQIHRLTQMVLRDRCSSQQRKSDQDRAEQLVAGAVPDDGADPVWWATWAALLPHLLILAPKAAGRQLRGAACDALWYLIMRGEFRTVHPLAEAWERHWQVTIDSEDEHLIRLASLIGYTRQSLGHYDEARKLNENTFSRSRQALGDDHPYTLFAANNLAINLHQLGDYEGARVLDQDTFDRRRRVLGEDHPDTLRSISNLAADLHQLGDYEGARAMDEDTLSRRGRMLGENHPSTLTSANNLANDIRQLGDYGRARSLDEDTLGRRRRVLGEDHPDTLRSISNLGYDVHLMGMFEQARALDEDVLSRRLRVLGEDHPDTLRSISNLAATLRQMGDCEQARSLDEYVFAQRTLLGPDRPATLFAASNLASDLRELGEYEQARTLDADTLARRRRVLGDDHPDTLRSISDLAADLRQLGNYEQARALTNEALTRLQRVLGEEHPRTVHLAQIAAEYSRY